MNAGIIHESLEIMYQEEIVFSRTGSADKYMKTRMRAILKKNFPNIQSVPIPITAIADFLAEYCKRTFDRSKDAPSSVENKSAQTTNSKGTDSVSKAIPKKWDNKSTDKNNGSNSKTESKETSKIQGEYSDEDEEEGDEDEDDLSYTPTKISRSRIQQSDDDDDISIVCEKKKEDKSPERDMPKDALSVCRYMLSKALPTIKSDLTEFIEYTNRFNSLKMVNILLKMFICF